MLRCDSDLGLVIYRTQLFAPAALPNVEKIEAQYRVEPLSAFLGEPAPPAAPAIAFYPPVNAFRSLTMYTMPESLLYANPIKRYLINSPMLPELTMAPDGGPTLIIQHDSPGADKAANWLPAPSGPL